MKPAGAGTDHMRGYLTYRALMGCCSQGQLIRGKRGEGLDQKGLVVIPTFVDGCESRLLFGHSSRPVMIGFSVLLFIFYIGLADSRSIYRSYFPTSWAR